MKIGLFIRRGTDVRIFFNEYTKEKISGGYAFIYNNHSEYLKEYAKNYNVTIVQLVNNLPEKHILWGDRFKMARVSKSRLERRRLYVHYGSADNRIKFKDLLKGNSFTYNLIKEIYIRKLSQYINSQIVTQLKSYNLDEVWVGGHGTSPEIAFAVNAKEAGLKVELFIHTWKQQFINSFILPLYSCIHVWDTAMKVEYLNQNSHLNESVFSIVGNPRFLTLKMHTPYKNISYYLEKYKIKANKYILYTAINPRNYDSEVDVMRFIYKCLNSDESLKNIGILIKTNPMDETPERWKELEKLPNIGVIYSDWEWFKELDFNLPSLESEKEWFDVLNYCMCTMSVASTVTIESLICNKPVINIGFEKNGIEFEKFIEYAHAPFYEPLLSDPKVFLIENETELKNTLKGICKEQK